MIEAGLVRAGEDDEPVAARFLLRPGDVPDRRSARAHRRLWRPRAVARRQAQIHQHRRDDASSRRGACSTISRTAREAALKGAAAHRRRRLYGCDRARGGGLRRRGGAVGHGAHRRPARPAVAGRRPSRSSAFDGDDAGTRAAQRASRLALAPSRCPASRSGLSSCPRARTRIPSSEALRAPSRCGRSSTRRSPWPTCCGTRRPKTGISPPPNGAPGWRRRSRRWSKPSGMPRSPTITGGTSPTASSRPSSSASGPKGRPPGPISACAEGANRLSLTPQSPR